MTTKKIYFAVLFGSLSVLSVLANAAEPVHPPVKIGSEIHDAALLKNTWQGWSLVMEGGYHFKTLPDADFSNVRATLGHKKEFWGELGVLGSAGFKYSRTFATSWYWDIRTLWTAFYPDVRWTGDRSRITLGAIPLIGKYVDFGSAPGYLTMLLPILYFDIGYITKNGYLFSLGSVYLWGLSPAFAIPFDDHWSMEFRTTVFLDRLFFDTGYHNLLGGVSISYKF